MIYGHFPLSFPEGDTVLGTPEDGFRAVLCDAIPEDWPLLSCCVAALLGGPPATLSQAALQGSPRPDPHPQGPGGVTPSTDHPWGLGSRLPGWGCRLGCGCRGRAATDLGASQKWDRRQGAARAQVPTGSPHPREPGFRAASSGSVCGSSAYGRVPGRLVPMGCLVESMGLGKQRRKTGTCSGHPGGHPGGRDQGAERGPGQLAEGVLPSGEAFTRWREGV